MIEPRAGAIEVPRVHGYVEFLDLLPATTCGRRAAEARRVTQVVKSRWVNVAK